MAPTAALLAEHGYVGAVLGYMQEPGLPSSFCRIPVEAFVAGIRAFAALPGVDSARVGVLAVSVGAVGPLVALGEDDAPPVRTASPSTIVVSVQPRTSEAPVSNETSDPIGALRSRPATPRTAREPTAWRRTRGTSVVSSV